MTHNPLTTLLDQRQLWRGRHSLPPGQEGRGTGFATLDSLLHQGGWPLAGSTELLCDQLGIGELWLLLPALHELVGEGPIAWLNPPCLPSPHALAQHGLPPERQLLVRPPRLDQQLWAAEEILRSGACSAMLSWFSAQTLQNRQLRRLHLAAQEGQCWHIHFRPSAAQEEVSPTPLRLSLAAAEQGLRIRILKQSGGAAGQALTLPRPAALYYQQRPVSAWPTVAVPSKTRRKRLTLLAPLTAPAASPLPGKPLCHIN